MKKTAYTKSESKIQQEIVQWYRNTYCLKHHNPRSMIFSIPNESNGPRAMKLIQTGLYPGCADLIAIHNRPEKWIPPQIFFIEVKIPTGVQSDKQKQFQHHCNQMGVAYAIVRSVEQFKELIEKL